MFINCFPGEYSCLRTSLVLKREYSFYLIQLYIPSFMLVVVSWVNFWIDKDAVPARVSLGVTTLLTMTTQASGVNAKLPPVSYTKAIDVWIGVCYLKSFKTLHVCTGMNWISLHNFRYAWLLFLLLYSNLRWSTTLVVLNSWPKNAQSKRHRCQKH